MGIDACREQLIEGEVQEGLRRTIDKRPHFLPMLLLHRLVTEGSDQVAVSRNVLDVCCCSLKDLVLLISAKFSLKLDELRLSLLDSLTNCNSVLLQEVLVVPMLLLISEGVPDGPEPVSDAKLLLELFYLLDIRYRKFEGLLVGLVLSKPLDALVKLPLNPVGLVEGLLCWRVRPDQGLAGCHLLDEGLDFFCLFCDSLVKLLQVAVSGLFGLID